MKRERIPDDFLLGKMIAAVKHRLSNAGWHTQEFYRVIYKTDVQMWTGDTSWEGFDLSLADLEGMCQQPHHHAMAYYYEDTVEAVKVMQVLEESDVF